MHVEIYRETTSKDWRWRLVASNGKTIADSAEGYRRRGQCTQQFEKIRAAMAAGPVRIVEVLA